MCSSSRHRKTHGMSSSYVLFTANMYIILIWQGTRNQAGHIEDEDGDGDGDGDEDEDDNDRGRQGGGKKTRARYFRNEDLPGLPVTMSKWHDFFLPRWYYYISTINNIWKLDHPDHVAIAQEIWNRKVSFPHTIALRDDPVFYLVSSLLIWFLC